MDNEFILANLCDNNKVSSTFQIIPDKKLDDFVDKCNSFTNNFNENISFEEDDDYRLPSNINSNYHNYSDFNNIKNDASSTFGIMHTNLASINKHFGDLNISLSLLNYEFEIIGITEHKILVESGPVTNIDFIDYHPFLFEPISTTHDGAGLYIKESLVYIERKDLQFNSPGNHESVFIEIIIPNKKNMIVGCIYRHPSSALSIQNFNQDIMKPLLTRITSENKLCSLVGDFNINLLNAGLADDISLFYNTLTSYFFAPFILQPSRPISGTLIDNIIINSIEFNSTSGNITIQISDHLIQFVLLEGFYKEIVPKKINIYERNFKNFNKREFEELLNSMNWDEIMCIRENDTNLSMENLIDTITYLLDETAPYKKISKKEYKLKMKPWISREILAKINERDKLLHKSCKEKDSERKKNLHNQYKIIRNSITKLKRESKITYYKKYFEQYKSKSSCIWKGIRSIVKISHRSRKEIQLIDDKGNLTSDPYKIAHLFNNFFVNIGTNIDGKIPKSKTNYTEYLKDLKFADSLFTLSPTSSTEILDLINSLDNHKSLGPNSVPTFLLKSFNIFFSNKLSSIINISFENGIFPNICKTAKVIPIYKKENPLLCENYRPISLLSIFSKIFEKAIYSRMYAYLMENNMIYDRQFGFRANHSSNHAIISLTESIKNHLDNKRLVGGVFIDLQKAFDTVNHTILCDKLIYYGFQGSCQSLLKSFLTNRKQFVSINGHKSSEATIKCGVPQGSTLGPLLFLIYINDLHLCLKKSQASHFADDTCIMHASNKLKTLESNLNMDLKYVSDWLKANRLSLNIGKTKLLIFHPYQKKLNMENIYFKLNGTKLTRSNCVNYLGMQIDEHLSWNSHVNLLSKNLSRANGILAKLRHFVPKHILTSVYYAIFYSHVLYGCSTWSLTSAENVEIVNILQKKCLRIMNFSPFNDHTNELFYRNNILKLNDVINNEKLKIIFDFKNNNLPIDLKILFQYNKNIHNHDTRNAINDGMFIPAANTTSFGIKSLRYICPVLWNELLKTDSAINDIDSTYHFKGYLKRKCLSSYK